LQVDTVKVWQIVEMKKPLEEKFFSNAPIEHKNEGLQLDDSVATVGTFAFWCTLSLVGYNS
jgi:hypothetical protein